MVLWCSASANSCLMISPVSAFSALFSLNLRGPASRAYTTREVTAPVKMNAMLTIYAAVLTGAVKAVITTEIVRLQALGHVGYQGCCPILRSRLK